MTKPLHVLFCEMYEQEIEATKSPEQVLLLKYLKEAKDDLPVETDAGWFFSAWRKVDVIYSRGFGSKDMIVWNLCHFDDAIHRVAEKFPWPKSDEKQ